MRALLRGEGLLRPTGRTLRGRAAADRRRPARAHPRPRVGAPHARRRADRVDARDAARHPRARAARQRRHRRLQPRAVHPRARRRRRHRHPAAGERARRPRSSRSCAPARARGSRTAAARRTATSWTRTTAWPRPCEEPGYQLRRVWLTKEEEQGYYYGFANEGLWPLCHIAHVRPTFRSSDWEQYERVNRRFADAVVEEARTNDPDRAGAGLSPRARAADDPRAAARRDDHHLLAHPVAEPRGVRDLPLARRAARRAARQQHPRIPHPVPLQQLRRHRRPAARGARRPRDVRRVVPRRAHADQALSDLRRVAARVGARGAARSTRAARIVRARHGLPADHMHRRRCRPARLHEGHRGAVPRRRAAARAASRVGRALHLRPDRRADAQQHRAVPGLRARACARSRSASTRGSRTRRAPAIVLLVAASRRRTRSTSTTARPTSASSAACTTA